MSFSSWSAFLDMGGYGLYVWGSYGFALASIVWVFLAIWWQHRRQLDQLRTIAQRQAELEKREDESEA
ncbi:MAG TPA: heme exporter protein CcmD [Gammaproteobacteria bacterium]|nr:heme exporter protein CcmD [Gammaproteobacteria bacterium]